jgi:hypothetical protein
MALVAKVANAMTLHFDELVCCLLLVVPAVVVLPGHSLLLVDLPGVPPSLAEKSRFVQGLQTSKTHTPVAPAGYWKRPVTVGGAGVWTRVCVWIWIWICAFSQTQA